ncbi:uncharacterized protein LOC143611430, partial [Bidens hawaiensis]|uniref:uncharacterized protein LOC143611430 n=1 Tax=Bidens hawaiensis TaxID=980011 RepID=UPI00404A9294
KYHDNDPLTFLICQSLKGRNEISMPANMEFATETGNTYSEVGNVDENVSSNKGAEGEITSKKEFSSCATNLVFSEVANIDDIISSGEQMEQENISTGNVTSENHCLEDLKQSSYVNKNNKRHIKDKISGHKKTDISSVKSSSRKAPIPEIHPKNQIFKHNPKVSSVNVVKTNNTKALPKSEKKRSKPLLDRLVNGNKKVVLKSHSTNHTEAAALTASTKKPRSVTVPSSFTFKSDERAAKRKQFSQKLEEKSKLKVF